jgi:hemerythrin-like domain-containing protein
MKRTDALAPLSRDHQHGLAVALQLRRATPRSAEAAREAFASYWAAEGSRHFRIEEELLLPAFARHGPADHEAVVQVLVDHVELRRRAADLELAETPDPEELRRLGERLERHIRHEERTLFPLVENTLPDAALGELAGEIERAEGSA